MGLLLSSSYTPSRCDDLFAKPTQSNDPVRVIVIAIMISLSPSPTFQPTDLSTYLPTYLPVPGPQSERGSNDCFDLLSETSSSLLSTSRESRLTQVKFSYRCKGQNIDNERRKFLLRL